MTCSARSPGIAANILSERLKRLEPEGRLIARLYSERPPRAACQLTAEGAELAGALRLPVRSCSGAADHQDPVMTSYLPLTCLLPASQQSWPGAGARAQPPILSVYGSAAVTAVFVALLGWLLAETRDGSVLGLAERLTTSIETCWPFIIAVALRRTQHPCPGLAIGGSGGAMDGAAARARARGRRQDR